ncbi:hypothetical protein ABZ318_17965 [Streptomyces sp. NPDC006197]|uniref:hypothetical protein n=1 Tax=Streptomyces sp. NPDC006197 TaxID=3156685 RepID=UPI0033A30044
MSASSAPTAVGGRDTPLPIPFEQADRDRGTDHEHTGRRCRQSWIDRGLRPFLGIDPLRISCYTTGHGDFHWADVAAPALVWEAWGGCRWLHVAFRR